MDAASKRALGRPGRASANVSAVGRYYLHGAIASGGMGTVHLGWRIDASRVVAIKALRADVAADPNCVALFSDEARIALRIVHRNVVRALEIVEAEGESFLVMEYVRGASLAQILRRVLARNELIPPPIAAGIAVGLLHGLHATHEARGVHGEPLNLVHRDVSPENVMVDTEGTSRVVDFGVAEAAGSARTARTGALKGKIRYMAPEQLSYDGVVSRRTDLYAASVVLWEMLCGRKLFEDDLRGGAPPPASGVQRACVDAFIRRYGEIPAPSSLVPGVARALEDMILRGLDPAPSRRFATAHEMALAVDASGQVASEAEIGAWLRSLEDPDLAERERLVRAVERSAGVLRFPSLDAEEEPFASTYRQCANAL